MQQPMQLTVRGIERSESITEYAKKRADKLDTFCSHVSSCHVTIDAPSAHHRHGGAYHVRIEMSVPGHVLVAGTHGGSSAAQSDVHAAIDDAFHNAERVLKRHAESQLEARR